MANAQAAVREKSPTRPVAQAIHAKLEAKFSDLVRLEDAVDPYTVITDGERFIEVMTHLKNDPELKFDFLRSVAGVDYPEANAIASVYHLYSYAHRHAHVVKFMCDREAPEVPTVERIWSTANWFEREAYDLLGIIYLGHSDLRRIMLPDDWEGFPLRKDYVEQQTYQGIGTTRPSPLDAFAAMDDKRRKARAERGEAEPLQVSSIARPAGSTDEEEAETEEEAS